MKKKWLKRAGAGMMTLAILLSNMFSLSASAYERIKNYPDFETDLFVADVITSDDYYSYSLLKKSLHMGHLPVSWLILSKAIKD